MPLAYTITSMVRPEAGNDKNSVNLLPVRIQFAIQAPALRPPKLSSATSLPPRRSCSAALETRSNVWRNTATTCSRQLCTGCCSRSTLRRRGLSLRSGSLTWMRTMITMRNQVQIFLKTYQKALLGHFNVVVFRGAQRIPGNSLQ